MRPQRRRKTARPFGGGERSRRRRRRRDSSVLFPFCASRERPKWCFFFVGWFFFLHLHLTMMRCPAGPVPWRIPAYFTTAKVDRRSRFHGNEKKKAASLSIYFLAFCFPLAHLLRLGHGFGRFPHDLGRYCNGFHIMSEREKTTRDRKTVEDSRNDPVTTEKPGKTFHTFNYITFTNHVSS